MSSDLAFIEFFTSLHNMTVGEVKELLKAQGLPVSGKKEDLLLRLVAYSPKPQGLGLPYSHVGGYTPEVIRSSVLAKVNEVLNPPFRNKVINWQSFPTELFT